MGISPRVLTNTNTCNDGSSKSSYSANRQQKANQISHKKFKDLQRLQTILRKTTADPRVNQDKLPDLIQEENSESEYEEEENTPSPRVEETLPTQREEATQPRVQAKAVPSSRVPATPVFEVIEESAPAQNTRSQAHTITEETTLRMIAIGAPSFSAQQAATCKYPKRHLQQC